MDRCNQIGINMSILEPTEKSFIDEVDLAVRARNLNKLIKMEKDFIQVESIKPFSPAFEHTQIRSSSRYKNMSLDGFGQKFILDLANYLSQARRTVEYLLKSEDYDGPVIVSEGDSWFQYPFKIKDTIDHLMRDYAVMSLGAAGDTIEKMHLKKQYRESIQNESPEFFLLSAGGNDILDKDFLDEIFSEYDPRISPSEHLVTDTLECKLTIIGEQLNSIIDECLEISPDLNIVYHGYDFPKLQKGSKYYKLLSEDKNLPSKVANSLISEILSKLNEEIKKVALQRPQNVTYINCLNVVGRDDNMWFDDIHPSDEGFLKVSQLFSNVIEQKRQK